ncbi:hypothetical protein V6N12_010760 [Hibiscus sabdariffa]|uniref:Uncharacterized protein n=1 Tax=Hibiscus sabdariffa TaxID=183260 RepID=A0ABR2EL22_9ROSI
MNKSSQPTPHMGLRFEALNEMNEDFIDTETAGLLIEHTEGVTKQGVSGTVSDREGLVVQKGQHVSKDNNS